MSQTSRSLPSVRARSAEMNRDTNTNGSMNGSGNGETTTLVMSSRNHRSGVYNHRRRRTVPTATLEGVVQMDNIRHAAPRHSFGIQHRFAPSKLTYVSAHHNSDLLAAIGPGPSKYYTDPSTDPTRPRAPGVSWGGQRAAAARAAAAAAAMGGGNPTSSNHGASTSRSHKQQQMYNEAAEVGPAAYAPSIGVNRPTAPRAKFGTASRFGGSLADHPPTIYHPQFHRTERAAPSYSIGPPGVAIEERGALRSERTFFMTHNVAGGLARAATLEDGVGPADYRPHAVLPRQPVYTFGGAGGPDVVSPDRFQKPGTQFLSSEHCRSQVGQHSPGPKYNNQQLDMASAGIAKSPRSHGLKWVP